MSRNYIPWTKEEVAIIRANSHLPLRKLALLIPNHTYKAVGVMGVTYDQTGTPRAQEHGHQPLLVISKTVRRLTPLECERLQGYPDNYTNIPGASDSARYKALGNSFAIPCAYFVISGCIAELEKIA